MYQIEVTLYHKQTVFVHPILLTASSCDHRGCREAARPVVAAYLDLLVSDRYASTEPGQIWFSKWLD